MLQSGFTHSCHHPAAHRIPLEELKDNPSALHNTVFKKLQRKAMLAGKRPPECDFCWRVEDLGQTSDRIFKSSAPWSVGHIERLGAMPWDANINPAYLEVSFSNVCNMACSYCSPHNSTTWQKDVAKHGRYPSTEHSHEGTPRIYPDDDNPYVKAFWRWFPEIYGDLQTVRVTGGEPLLSEDTFKLFDYVLENPHPELTVAVNSNLCVPEKAFQRLIDMFKRLKGKVHEVHIYVSIDTYGPQAEYIRDGLNFNKFKASLLEVINQLPHVHPTIMCTFNAMSIPSFPALVDEVGQMKKKSTLILDIPYLRHPNFMSIKILDPAYSIPELDKIIQLAGAAGFYDWEVNKLNWLKEWAKQPEGETELRKMRANFFRYFTAYDQRRGKSFLSTFPELAGLWEVCREASL